MFAALLVTGCGDDELDSTPEKKDGSESSKFEGDDIERAQNASPMVKAYCAGGVSEAQVTGCRSHVTDAEICEQDTDGKVAAVEALAEETGDDPCE